MILDLGPVALHYEVAGSAVDALPVMLSHGVIESSVSWGRVVPVLCRQHRVVVYDARGRGHSTGPDRPFGYAELVADVEALATHAGIDRLYHAGHSMGARVALEHALTHPARVAGMALVSGRATAPGEAGGQRLANLAQRVDREGPSWGVTLWARPGQPAYAEARAISAANPRSGTVRALEALVAMDDLLPELGKIHVPVLIVVGDRDASYVASAREMAEALPNATVRVLEGVGHFPNLECPELLGELLVAHAAECR